MDHLKITNVVNVIHEENIDEFYFKNSIDGGYRLKLIKDSKLFDNIYLTDAEAEDLLNKLHIKTDSLLFKVFKLDIKKELEVKRMVYYIHELGIINSTITSANVTKEDLVNAIVHLGIITKDKEIASLDFEVVTQEEIYNVLHDKHLEYLSKYEDVLLTDVNSAS